jgi:hypothetical protein
MSLGEILDRTAQLYRTNFMLFAGIAGVYSGILLVLNLGQIGMQHLLLHLHMAKQLPWFTFGFLILIIPLMFIFAGAAVAANNRAVAWINLGQPATIRGAYASTLPRLGRYLWLMTIVTFFIYIPFIVLFIAYFIFLFAYARPHQVFAAGGANANPQAAIVFLVVTLAFAVLSLGAFVYTVLMALRYSLGVPASVIEDLKARKAIRRSIELSKGSRGRIFVLLLLIFVIEIGLVTITQLFFVFAMFAAVRHHAEVPVWMQITQQIVGFLTNTFIGPMYATGLTLFYYDQRIRKEGFDIEWMMAAAGMTAEVTPPATPPTTMLSETGVWEPLPEFAQPAPIEPGAHAEPQASGPLDGTTPPETPPEGHNG